MDHEARRRVAREQLGILAEGAYVDARGRRVEIRDALAEAVRDTRLFRERDLAARASTASRLGRPRVSTRPARSGDCARALLDEGARHVAILNYANGVHPGGGFLHGARAQEESLCRMSGLYACLSSTNEDAVAFYDENAAAATALVTGHVLVSVGVPFFRDEDLALLDTPWRATVLTAAAPDLSWLHARTSERLEPLSRYDELPDVFARRTRGLLVAARAVGCDTLVLGPWGCGAFGNDPELVARAFDEAIAAEGAGFSAIVFSTWGPEKNRAAFEARFAPP